MKANLEFNLPEDKTDFYMANNGWNYYLVLESIDQKLRSYLKYGHKFESADDALQDIRNLLHEEMNNRNITFDIDNV